MEYKKTLNLPKTKFPMKANLNQSEPKMLKRWAEMDLYSDLKKKKAEDPPFILHDGPPYANGHLHLGHTVNKVLKDIIVKSRLMAGHYAPFVPGWDCHGLPIEHNVEKQLGKKKKEMGKLSIRKACRKYAEKFVKIQRQEFERLGVLGDWDNPYLTMNYGYEASIAREFCRIFLDGHVVKSTKPVYWCPTCVTALAEAEVEYAPHRSDSITVKFPCSGSFNAWLRERAGIEPDGNTFILIWTTTPWTLPANQAVAVHPDFDYSAVKVSADALKRVGMKPEGDSGFELWIMASQRIMPVISSIGLEQKDIEVLAEFRGSDMENLEVRHPFIDRTGLVINADYVTLDSGTGCVHIAPGHGAEDYESSRKYDLEVYSPVDDRGCFTPDVEGFQGMHIFKANPEIVKLLRERGRLVHQEEMEHSYPHCWRCKRPVIFRATAQWFISMEKKGLRKEALDNIMEVKWIPSWGRERIYGMVEARPDWCISRQRAWGVPITVFICRQCQTPFMDQETADRIVQLFQEEGADSWFSRPPEDFLGKNAVCQECGGHDFEREEDILDVWFDSGVSHAAVLEQREDLSWPADMYLEGSDQHRGWFQSSLLTSVATRHKAPYRQVLTHGFVVDAKGKKMSKSVGNVIPPDKVIKRFGAEILRLWVSAEDYQDDIKISDEILQRLTEAYRKIRNTIRFLLGNLYDFDPEKDRLDVSEMEPIDRWALFRARQIMERVQQAYGDYRFHVVFHSLYQFCTVDMSAQYLDILKDRLYCEAPSGRLRRSAQTAMYDICMNVIINMAPVLSFTAEEAWKYLSGEEDSSVFFQGIPSLPDNSLSDQEVKYWDSIWRIRGEITKALEFARREKRIGLALDAKVLLVLPEDTGLELNDELKETLKLVTIVSQFEIVDGFTKEQEEEGNIWHSQEVPGLACLVISAAGTKCERCWTWSEDIGQDDRFPDVCPRCARVLRELQAEA